MQHARRWGLAIASFAAAVALLTPSAALAATDGDFEFTENGGAATITAYTGVGTALDIPSTLSDASGTYPVTVIGNDAFAGRPLTSVRIPGSVTAINGGAFLKTQLTKVWIGASVTSIGMDAFGYTQIASVIFAGDAPTSLPSMPFDNPWAVTVHYYSGAAGFTTPTWLLYASREISAAASDLSFATAGAPVADGTLATVATISVRDSTGTDVALDGVPVAFSFPSGVVASAGDCVTDATGTCSITLGATAPGTFTIAATVGGDPTSLTQSMTFSADPATGAGAALPPTGAPTIELIVLAASLLAAGFALRLGGRFLAHL